jgi:hypothetical protein
MLGPLPCSFRHVWHGKTAPRALSLGTGDGAPWPFPVLLQARVAGVPHPRATGFKLPENSKVAANWLLPVNKVVKSCEGTCGSCHLDMFSKSCLQAVIAKKVGTRPSRFSKGHR